MTQHGSVLLIKFNLALPYPWGQVWAATGIISFVAKTTAASTGTFRQGLLQVTTRVDLTNYLFNWTNWTSLSNFTNLTNLPDLLDLLD